MSKTVIGLLVVGVVGFFVWQVVKPKIPQMKNPGMTNGPYSTPTQPTNSSNSLTTGILSLGTGLANAFSAYENRQTYE